VRFAGSRYGIAGSRLTCCRQRIATANSLSASVIIAESTTTFNMNCLVVSERLERWKMEKLMINGIEIALEPSEQFGRKGYKFGDWFAYPARSDSDVERNDWIEVWHVAFLPGPWTMMNNLPRSVALWCCHRAQQQALVATKGKRDGDAAVNALFGFVEEAPEEPLIAQPFELTITRKLTQRIWARSKVEAQEAARRAVTFDANSDGWFDFDEAELDEIDAYPVDLITAHAADLAPQDGDLISLGAEKVTNIESSRFAPHVEMPEPLSLPQVRAYLEIAGWVVPKEPASRVCFDQPLTHGRWVKVNVSGRVASVNVPQADEVLKPGPALALLKHIAAAADLTWQEIEAQIKQAPPEASLAWRD